MNILSRTLVLAGLLVAGASASAQNYPSRLISVVVPFAAGSGTDSVARIVAHELSGALNARVIVENKAGASGAIAADFVARSAPDGYTLFMTTNTTHSANPSLLKSISYDPVKDFAAISRVGSLPFMLVINPRLPITSVKELVAYIKANPDKLTYAYGNSTGLVAGETLKRRAGVDALKVPYKSTPSAINDVIAGHVAFMFVDLTSGISSARAGSLRALAVSTAERSSILPDVPSMKESGIEDFDLNSWNGLFAPANTSKEIVTLLNREMQKIIAKPGIKEKLANLGFDAFSSTPEELDAFVKTELFKWTELIKGAGIEAE